MKLNDIKFIKSMNLLFKKLTTAFQSILIANQNAKKLFEQLIYGRQMCTYNKQTKLYARSYLYLNERSAEMLMCLEQSGAQKVFDLRQVYIILSNYKYQMQYNLEQQKYIILSQGSEEVILIFSHVEDRKQFYKSLRCISKMFNQKLVSDYDPTILKNFIKADSNSNQELSIKQVKQVVRLLKVQYNQEIDSIISYVRKENATNKKDITFRDFQKIAKIYSCRKELIPIFQTYSKVKFNYYNFYMEKTMTKEQFAKFLTDQQYQTQSSIIESITNSLFQKNTLISFYQFCRYIFNKENNAHDASITSEFIDMNHPLNHYYCYSSHNTYLTGNQLTSDSRAQRYWEDLIEGIRCVELDVHDGNNEPIIKHGYTMTRPITFDQAIKTIMKFCEDEPLHTPIILSIQNHCNISNQLKMAKILKKTFKDKIIRVKGDVFPTLKECIGKIIIKCDGNYKMYKKYILSNEEKSMDEQGFNLIQFIQNLSTKQIQINEQQEDPNQSPRFIIKKQSVLNLVGEITEAPQAFIKHRRLFAGMRETLKKDKFLWENKQSSIIRFMKNNYQQHKAASEGKHTINLALLGITSMMKGVLGQPCPWENLSLSQSKIQGYYEKDKDLIIKQSTIGWVRSYPSGSRLDSSNYNPLYALEMGIQILALNSQISDKYTFLMKSFFRKGSYSCAGYRYKLDDMKNKSEEVKKVVIQVISCSRISQNEQSDSIPPVDVRISFIGTQRDMQSNLSQTQHKKYTETIKGNAYNPVFRLSSKVAFRFQDCSFAFVYMEVKDCGVTVLPLNEIKKGYRVVYLYGQQNRLKDSKILCKITA